MTKKILIEIKATGILVLGIAFLILLISFIDIRNSPYTFIISFFSYILVATIVHSIGSFIKNKYFDLFAKLIWFPIGILYGVLTVIIPLMTLLTHMIFYFIISFLIPLLIFESLNFFRLIDFLNFSTIVYLKITLTVFIAVLLNPILREIIYRYSPIRFKKSENLKPYELDKLTDYVLSVDNVRFLVYGSYVIALLMTNYYNFQGESITSNIESDKSVLQSFVTFIAFDRTFILMKQLNFRPSGLLNLIRKSISNKLSADTNEKT